VLLDGNVPAPGRRRACVDYEFPQERADIDHTTVSWKFPDELWDEVQRSHGHAAGHNDAMGGVCRNPDGSTRRNDPDAVFRPNRHHAFGCENELIGVVKMLGHQGAIREFVTQRGELR